MTRWTHTIAILAIAILFANVQCHALCLASVCQTASTKRADGCHHSSHSQKDANPGCQHQQSSSPSTEATPDLAKISAVPLSLLTVFLPVASLLPQFDGSNLGDSLSFKRGSPPGKPLFLSLSVIRI
jgi:hypothetical protein